MHVVSKHFYWGENDSSKKTDKNLSPKEFAVESTCYVAIWRSEVDTTYNYSS